jgi:5-formyltetrahydrofolate cyclo-ligase
MDKKAIREVNKRARAEQSVSEAHAASIQVCTRLRSLEAYRHAKKIAFYYSVNGEVDLNELWKNAILQNKLCYFPVLDEHKRELTFLPATAETPFHKNRFGIAEPSVSPDLAIPVEELDLVLVPLVAFDVHCHRLGMGAGYYDRTFKDQANAKLFGVAYQFQRVDALEQDPWDVQLSAVITQRAIYWYGG